LTVFRSTYTATTDTYTLSLHDALPISITFHVTCDLRKVYQERIVNPKKSVFTQQVFIFLEVLAHEELTPFLQVKLRIGSFGLAVIDVRDPDEFQSLRRSERNGLIHFRPSEISEQSDDLTVIDITLFLFRIFSDSLLQLVDIDRFQQVIQSAELYRF